MYKFIPYSSLANSYLISFTYVFLNHTALNDNAVGIYFKKQCSKPCTNTKKNGCSHKIKLLEIISVDSKWYWVDFISINWIRITLFILIVQVIQTNRY